VIGVAVNLGIGAPRMFLLIYVIGVLLALLGALVAARQPGNAIGWLMVTFAAVFSQTEAAAAYGYAALGVHHGGWPLGSLAAWIGAWTWVPTLGFLSLIAVRFPDGRPRRFSRLVDVVYIAGTALFVAAVALLPAKLELSFSAVPSPRLDQSLPYFQDPVGSILQSTSSSWPRSLRPA
jgi:hypothetical protein